MLFKKENSSLAIKMEVPDMGKVSTEQTKNLLGIGDSAIRKLRALYREKGRICDNELFEDVVLEKELREIVQMQKENPRFSFEICYDRVILQNAAKTQAILDAIANPRGEDAKGLSISDHFEMLIGVEEKDRFFALYQQLIDFIAPYDPASQNMLINLQELIISNIIINGAGSIQEAGAQA